MARLGMPHKVETADLEPQNQHYLSKGFLVDETLESREGKELFQSLSGDCSQNQNVGVSRFRSVHFPLCS